ncbi:hypothetical protein BANRA_02595 [Acinetobacter baumannii]|nr:hypothetical protein BANRA_03436 [Acinetobacter baumannii]VDA17198.1 hypothetical protein BANRA_02595 [Acinetobacter baumannii]
MTLQSDFQKLEPGGLIHLYELDASSYGVGILRFHGHQQMESIFGRVRSLKLLVWMSLV